MIHICGRCGLTHLGADSGYSMCRCGARLTEAEACHGTIATAAIAVVRFLTRYGKVKP